MSNCAGSFRHPIRTYRDRIKLWAYRRGPHNATYDASYLIDGAWTGWTCWVTTTATRQSTCPLSVWSTASATMRRGSSRSADAPGANRTPSRTWLRSRWPPLHQEHAATARAEGKKKSGKVPGENRPHQRHPASGVRGTRHRQLARGRHRPPPRASYRVNGGQEPRQSTISNLNSAWLEILEDAQHAGHITKRARQAAGHFAKQIPQGHARGHVHAGRNAVSVAIYDR